MHKIDPSCLLVVNTRRQCHDLLWLVASAQLRGASTRIRECTIAGYRQHCIESTTQRNRCRVNDWGEH